MSLKSLLQRSKAKSEHTANGGDIADFTGIPQRSELPVESDVTPNVGKPDQCFIICPDVHSYSRDKAAFNVFMKSLPLLAAKYNVTKFVQLGDLLECGVLSSHPDSIVYEQIPEYSDEVKWAVEEFWKPAIEALPNANMYALMGNHEERLNKWIAMRMGRSEIAASIYNDYMPTQVYEELGVHVTPYGRADINEGVLELTKGLVAIHGWSIAKNASKTHLDLVAGGQSVIFGHTHRAQSDYRKHPITKDYMRGQSFGALAQTSMNWHKGRPMDHTLGFGVVFTYGEKFFIRHIDIQMDGDRRVCILPIGDVIEC
jgi:hypothetical protein